MQIFTTEMLIQIYAQSREFAHELSSAIIGAVWQNIVSLPAVIITSVADGDWKSAIVTGFLLFGGVVWLYRVVRKKLWTAIHSALNC